MGFIKDILERIPSAFFGVLGSLAVTVVLAFVLSWALGIAAFDWKTYQPSYAGVKQITQSHEADIAIVHAVGLSVVLLITRLLLKWSDEDRFSPLRKKLVGKWSVAAVYRDKTGNNQRYVSTATISLDRIQKLCIALELNRDDHFSETTIEVHDIALNPRRNPSTLVYYAPVSRLRLSDNVTVTTRYFVMLEVMQSNGSIPARMQGTWHELTGAHDVPKAGNITFDRS